MCNIAFQITRSYWSTCVNLTEVITNKLKPYLPYESNIGKDWYPNLKGGREKVQSKHMYLQKNYQRMHWMEKVKEKHQ